MAPSRSTTSARELVVPWSSARMKGGAMSRSIGNGAATALAGARLARFEAVEAVAELRVLVAEAFEVIAQGLHLRRGVGALAQDSGVLAGDADRAAIELARGHGV